MAETKYGRHLIEAPFELDKGGRGLHVLNFAAANYGVNATWVLLPVIKPSTGESLPTHSHDFFQFISWFGANPENIGEFEAEEYICLGEEQEKHIVNTPTVQVLPPGTPHCPGGWLKVDKPVYHLDVFFADDWVKKDTAIPDTPDRRKPGTRYSKNFVPAGIAPAHFGPPVPTFHFSTADYGVDAGWILVPFWNRECLWISLMNTISTSSSASWGAIPWIYGSSMPKSRYIGARKAKNM